MTATSHWLLAALLVSGSAASAQGPAGKDLFIRGAFNGWGLDNAMVYKGKGVYEADILISPGNHAFKVGSKDWSAEWVIDPNASIKVATDTDYRMDTSAGPEDYLFVKTTAPYKFSVDVTDPKAPRLRVTRLPNPAVAAIDPHKGHQQQVVQAWPTFDGKQETVRFSVQDAAAAQRTYAQSTTMQLRDPGPQYALYSEPEGLPVARTGNLAFDALFALAGFEMKQNSVSEIKDGNYNGGAAIACACFETGEKWHYVWTRDLSYAADLGLAMLDPARTRNSLDFKLSPFRKGVVKAPQVAGSQDGLQIIQDTGSGGSWPVSTDRVTWAFGAEEALKSLPAAERKPFAARALKALANTIENDRIAAFDKESGLYTGEQSFLDWRDQSYAAWIVNDLSSMASSKSLSTNVGHYKALTLTASLAAEHGDDARARKYKAWARDLKKAINTRLWLPGEGMYSSLSAGHFDGAAMHKFDWLGQSLAIVTGIADEAKARSILSRYPHGPMGAPVIYPQQPGIPVYHNRAMWPFVTAYGLKAAAIGGNASVADAAYDTLMRGAAVNLSNMENLEWLSGQPLLLDEANPSLIGPVINSRRQLWSVGAYLGMVVENVFGVTLEADSIRLRPFITAKLRREAFGTAEAITLRRLRLHGKQVDVRVELPPASSATGYYDIDKVTLNGVPAQQQIRLDQLKANNTITVTLGALRAGQQAIRRVSADPYAESPDVFGPREPVITRLAHDGAAVALDIGAGGNPAGTVYNVYRDGKLVAARVAAGTWRDARAMAGSCYAVEAQFEKSGNRSHHSAPRCTGAGLQVPVTDARVKSNLGIQPSSVRFAAPHLKDWGKPGDRFAVDAVRIDSAGQYRVQIQYHNGANQINLGISGGVKWLMLKNAAGRVVAQGVVQLPHARVEKENTPLVYSTPLQAHLAAGSYRIELSDFYNMSYLDSNSTFSAAGGTHGPWNRVDIYGVRILKAN
ncbi:MGH1-like glycoside hydrolase domain-containing protein [Massilia soli]|uniref:Esterase n=1 Tax=Massilia soli TaxID=2792854 RepID=A0ABS7STF7_9BURK|nr:esterase [Massilia soli]MBZ2209224.1 esterase [Massilia soli]